GQVIGRDAPGQGDGSAHLGKVFRAVKAVREVRFEPAALRRGHGAPEVFSDKLDCLLAGQALTRQGPQASHRVLPNSDSMTWRSLLRPRCKSTRWLTLLIPRMAQTSSPLSPCTSRRVTT